MGMVERTVQRGEENAYVIGHERRAGIGYGRVMRGYQLVCRQNLQRFSGAKPVLFFLPRHADVGSCVPRSHGAALFYCPNEQRPLRHAPQGGKST